MIIVDKHLPEATSTHRLRAQRFKSVRWFMHFCTSASETRRPVCRYLFRETSYKQQTELRSDRNGRNLSQQAGCFFSIHPGESMGYCWSLCGVRWTPERKAFRTINVQWIGQWGLFSRCSSSENQ